MSSWIIVDKRTGLAVMETYNQTTAKRVRLDRFDVLPADEYLQELNARIIKADSEHRGN